MSCILFSVWTIRYDVINGYVPSWGHHGIWRPRQLTRLAYIQTTRDSGKYFITHLQFVLLNLVITMDIVPATSRLLSTFVCCNEHFSRDRCLLISLVGDSLLRQLCAHNHSCLYVQMDDHSWINVYWFFVCIVLLLQVFWQSSRLFVCLNRHSHLPESA